VPHLSHEHQHLSRIRLELPRSAALSGPARSASTGADRLAIVRYLALLVLAIVFLTGLVWWVLFLGNSVLHLFRRR
jgi:hypothetical protein